MREAEYMGGQAASCVEQALTTELTEGLSEVYKMLACTNESLAHTRNRVLGARPELVSAACNPSSPGEDTAAHRLRSLLSDVRGLARQLDATAGDIGNRL